jgi:rhodanese-related sulfurtransferase
MCVVIVLIFSMTAVSWTAVKGAEVERITKESLKEMLDDPMLVIMDVRVKSHWESSNRKIKGAIREDPKDVEAWMKRYDREKTLVLYCK